MAFTETPVPAPHPCREQLRNNLGWIVCVSWVRSGGVGMLNEAINKIIFYPAKEITAWHQTTKPLRVAPPVEKGNGI